MLGDTERSATQQSQQNATGIAKHAAQHRRYHHHNLLH